MNINKQSREIKQGTMDILDRMVAESTELLKSEGFRLCELVENLFDDLPTALAIMESYNTALMIKEIGEDHGRFFNYMNDLKHYKIKRGNLIDGKCSLNSLRPVLSAKFRFQDPLLYSIWSYSGVLNNEFFNGMDLCLSGDRLEVLV